MHRFCLLAGAASMLLLSGCFSSMMIDYTPGSGVSVAEGTPDIKTETAIVLDHRLASHKHITAKAYRQWSGKSWVNSPYRLETGEGMESSLRWYLPRLFENSRVANSVLAAVTSGKGERTPELVVRPEIVTTVVTDHGASASGVVVLRVYLLAGDATPLGSLDVTGRSSNVPFHAAMKMTSSSDPGLQDRYVTVNRLTGALDKAYDDLLHKLAPEITSNEVVRAVVAGNAKSVISRTVVRYQAAAACAKQKGKGMDAVHAQFGLTDSTARERMQAAVARMTPAERLRAHLVGCGSPDQGLDALLDGAVAALDQAIKAERYAAAKATLAALMGIDPKQPRLASAQQRLAAAEQATQQRLAAEKKAAALAAQQAADAAARKAADDAAERARRQARAAELVAAAQKLLKKKKYDEARQVAFEALRLDPGRGDAQVVVNMVNAHQQAVANKKRQQYLRKLKAQVPSLIKACESAARKWTKAGELLQKAAAAGRPGLVEKMELQKRKASLKYNQARMKVREAIRAYEQEGLGEAARAVRRAARTCNP